jgi:hypothetical protein
VRFFAPLNVNVVLGIREVDMSGKKETDRRDISHWIAGFG